MYYFYMCETDGYVLLYCYPTYSLFDLRMTLCIKILTILNMTMNIDLAK